MNEDFYTTEQKILIGDHYAKILNIPKDKMGFYKTNFGKKNSLGIFNTLMALTEKVRDNVVIEEILNI